MSAHIDNKIEKLRKETPACDSIYHFNNAGAALSPIPVLTAYKNHIDLEAMIGGYEAANQALQQSEHLYQAAAQLINCEANEIAFLENATRAWDMAFYSLPWQKGDRILTALSEYGSNYLAFLHLAKKIGVKIDVIANDRFGQIDLNDLENKIASDVKLIAITHIPTQGGLINPAAAVGEIAKRHGIPYLLDTTQSIGQLPIDVKEIGCDFLCATGRKFLRGPRGTGFLYASKCMLNQCHPPFIYLQAATWIAENDYELRPDAKRFESLEQNFAAKIGLAAAIDYALALGMPNIWQRIKTLATTFRDKLAKVRTVTLQDLGEHQCGIVTFTAAHKTPNAIQQALAKHKINVAIPIQEFARLDLAKRNIPALVRASIHYYNTETEIDYFCEVLNQILH